MRGRGISAKQAVPPSKDFEHDLGVAHEFAFYIELRNRRAVGQRIMHWIGATAIICMFLSGWAIYSASPSLPFTFPRNLTLGGWLAACIAWHISVMSVSFADRLACVAHGIASKHFWRDLRPTGPRAVLRDLWDALRFRLTHRLGHYTAVQGLLYTGVILCLCLAVLTGLSIWKLVQLG
jgi:thiosulfate reductase cytochrome b subunit